MKKILLVCIALGCSGCASLKDPAFQKEIAKGMISAALALCIAENPDENEQTLRALCRFTDAEAPLVRDLLSAQKRGIARHLAAMK